MLLSVVRFQKYEWVLVITDCICVSRLHAILTMSCIYCAKSLWPLQLKRASGVHMFGSRWEIRVAYINGNITVPG